MQQSRVDNFFIENVKRIIGQSTYVFINCDDADKGDNSNGKTMLNLTLPFESQALFYSGYLKDIAPKQEGILQQAALGFHLYGHLFQVPILLAFYLELESQLSWVCSLPTHTAGLGQASFPNYMSQLFIINIFIQSHVISSISLKNPNIPSIPLICISNLGGHVHMIEKIAIALEIERCMQPVIFEQPCHQWSGGVSGLFHVTMLCYL